MRRSTDCNPSVPEPLLWDTDRVGRIEYLWNQSVAGGLARLFPPEGAPTWVLAVLGGVALAIVIVRLRPGRELDALPAVTLVGVVGLLVSPVRWAHHAVRVVPALLVTAAWLPWRATRGEGWAALLRAGRIAFLVCTFVVRATPQRLVRLPTIDFEDVDMLGRLASAVPMVTLVAALFLTPVALRRPPESTVLTT